MKSIIQGISSYDSLAQRCKDASIHQNHDILSFLVEVEELNEILETLSVKKILSKLLLLAQGIDEQVKEIKQEVQKNKTNIVQEDFDVKHSREKVKEHKYNNSGCVEVNKLIAREVEDDQYAQKLKEKIMVDSYKSSSSIYRQNNNNNYKSTKFYLEAQQKNEIGNSLNISPIHKTSVYSNCSEEGFFAVDLLKLDLKQPSSQCKISNKDPECLNKDTYFTCSHPLKQSAYDTKNSFKRQEGSRSSSEPHFYCSQEVPQFLNQEEVKNSDPRKDKKKNSEKINKLQTIESHQAKGISDESNRCLTVGDQSSSKIKNQQKRVNTLNKKSSLQEDSMKKQYLKQRSDSSNKIKAEVNHAEKQKKNNALENHNNNSTLTQKTPKENRNLKRNNSNENYKKEETSFPEQSYLKTIHYENFPPNELTETIKSQRQLSILTTDTPKSTLTVRKQDKENDKNYIESIKDPNKQLFSLKHLNSNHLQQKRYLEKVNFYPQHQDHYSHELCLMKTNPNYLSLESPSSNIMRQQISFPIDQTTASSSSGKYLENITDPSHLKY